MKHRVGISISMFLLIAATGYPATAQSAGASKAAGMKGKKVSTVFSPSVLIQPTELEQELRRPEAQRPIVLHVGFAVLYQGSHIPGAIHAGPASTEQGLEDLRRAASRISRDHQVVIYCGCCPMDKCPNIHPAYEALKKMGFQSLKVLNLPHDFAHDWAEKGLPVVKGSAKR